MVTWSLDGNPHHRKSLRRLVTLSSIKILTKTRSHWNWHKKKAVKSAGSTSDWTKRLTFEVAGALDVGQDEGIEVHRGLVAPKGQRIVLLARAGLLPTGSSTTAAGRRWRRILWNFWWRWRKRRGGGSGEHHMSTLFWRETLAGHWTYLPPFQQLLLLLTGGHQFYSFRGVCAREKFNSRATNAQFAKRDVFFSWASDGRVPPM